MYRRLLLILLLLWFPPTILAAEGVAAVAVGQEQVYAQARLLEQEVAALVEHFGAPAMEVAVPLESEMQPRHVWQKSYAILIQLNQFRRRHGLPAATATSVEPVLRMEPWLVYEQLRRLLTEVRLIETRFGVEEQPRDLGEYAGRSVGDAFNVLQQVALDVEALTGEGVDPSTVFAEAIRVHEDVRAILRRLTLEDDTFPPRKLEAVTPQESLTTAFELLGEIQRLQRSAGIPRSDFSEFAKAEGAQPRDVFAVVGLALAELQPLKAHLDMPHATTPAAEYFERKSPADVQQLLAWCVRKLRLIEEL